MKHIVFYILAITTLSVFSQEEKKQAVQTIQQAKDLVYQGNEMALNEDYTNAEMEYRKAISKEPSLAVGNYNLANAYYEKGSFDEALYRLQQAAKAAVSKEEKHKAYHNIGNVLMQNKKCKEAADAFKNALRNNPADEETRYNYALAKQCAEEQQDQQDENKDQNDQNDENKDQDDKQEDQKENEDENKEDQKDEGEEDQKEGDDQKDEKGDPKDEKDKDGNEENKEKEQQKPQPQPGQLSPQQIKNLLEAMNNQEEKVQEKINAEKTKGAKVKSEKDW